MLMLQNVHAQGNLSDLNGIVDQRKNVFGGKLAVMVWKDTIVYQKSTGDKVTSDFTVATREISVVRVRG